MAEVGEKYNDFSGSLQGYYDLVNQNRSELAPMEDNSSASGTPAAASEAGDQTAYDDSDDLDEDDDADYENEE